MINYKEKLATIRAFVFDFDGVMTDGSVWVYADRETVRAGNIKDGFAIQYAVKHGYTVAVISGATSASIDNRMQMLGVDQYNAVTDILGGLGVPIIMDLDIGHLPPMMPIVSGSMGNVTVKDGSLKLEMEYI